MQRKTIILCVLVLAVAGAHPQEDRRGSSSPAVSSAPEPQERRTFKGIEMVWCPSGRFLMGSPEHEEGREKNETLHEVTLTKGFWIAQYEITKAQREAVMGTAPWAGERGVSDAPDSPAVFVAWTSATSFTEKLGDGFRLPTEAEWEYACRAGSTTAYCFGDDVKTLEAYAWCVVTPQSGRDDGAHRVGLKKPNNWNLHDMHGNVWEWVADLQFREYTSEPRVDPKSAVLGEHRVKRGGAFTTYGAQTRSARRSKSASYLPNTLVGLRVARNP